MGTSRPAPPVTTTLLARHLFYYSFSCTFVSHIRFSLRFHPQTFCVPMHTLSPCRAIVRSSTDLPSSPDRRGLLSLKREFLVDVADMPLLSCMLLFSISLFAGNYTDRGIASGCSYVALRRCYQSFLSRVRRCMMSSSPSRLASETHRCCI